LAAPIFSFLSKKSTLTHLFFDPFIFFSMALDPRGTPASVARMSARYVRRQSWMASPTLAMTNPNPPLAMFSKS
jgi:hypothetical protein